MVHNVNEAVSVHAIPHDGSEFGAALGSGHLGEVDDRQVGPVHYGSTVSNLICRDAIVDLQSSLVARAGTYRGAKGIVEAGMMMFRRRPRDRQQRSRVITMTGSACRSRVLYAHPSDIGFAK